MSDPTINLEKSINWLRWLMQTNKLGEYSDNELAGFIEKYHIIWIDTKLGIFQFSNSNIIPWKYTYHDKYCFGISIQIPTRTTKIIT